eukprot:5655562-Amphidinium_carterae.1
MQSLRRSQLPFARTVTADAISNSQWNTYPRSVLTLVTLVFQFCECSVYTTYSGTFGCKHGDSVHAAQKNMCCELLEGRAVV